VVSPFASRRVDGCVIMPASHHHSYLLNERKAGTALVFVDRPPSFLDADTVLTDNLGGARRGIQHLLAHGHRRIAYVGDLQSIVTAALRYQGYREELDAHHLPLDPDLVRLDLRVTDPGDEPSTQILSLRPAPTAIFAAQNL